MITVERLKDGEVRNLWGHIICYPQRTRPVNYLTVERMTVRETPVEYRFTGPNWTWPYRAQ